MARDKPEEETYRSPLVGKGGRSRESARWHNDLRKQVKGDELQKKVIRDNPTQVEPFLEYRKPGTKAYRALGPGGDYKRKPSYEDPYQFEGKPLPIKPIKGYKTGGFPRVTEYAKPRNKPLKG